MLTVYTSSRCPYCDKVKNYLRLHGHQFIEIDVSINELGAEHLMKLGIHAVPVTEGDNWVVIGYDINKLEKELGKKMTKEDESKVRDKLKKNGFM